MADNNFLVFNAPVGLVGFDLIFGNGNYIDHNTIHSSFTLGGANEISEVTDNGTYLNETLIQPVAGFEPILDLTAFNGQDVINFGTVGDTYFLRHDESGSGNFQDFKLLHDGSVSFTAIAIYRLDADNWVYGTAFSSSDNGILLGTDGSNNFNILIANGSAFIINQSININTLMHNDWIAHIWGYNKSSNKYFQAISGDKLRSYTPTGTQNTAGHSTRFEIGRRPSSSDYSDLNMVHSFFGIGQAPDECYNDLINVIAGPSYWSALKAAQFSRNDDAYFTSDDSFFDLADESVTFGGWFYAENSTANDGYLGKYRTGNESYMLWKQGGGPSWRFHMNDGTNGVIVVSSQSIVTGWHYVVSVYDHVNDVAKISVDGGAFDTAVFSGGFNTGSAELFGMGGYSGFGSNLGNNFQGDQVFMLKGKAMSLSEIQAWYNSGNGVKYNDLSASEKIWFASNKGAWWTMDQFKLGFDETGNGNHITNNNGVRNANPKVT